MLKTVNSCSGAFCSTRSRYDGILSKSTSVQNPPDQNQPDQNPPDQNQPDLKSNRVEENTLLYLFIFKSIII